MRSRRRRTTSGRISTPGSVRRLRRAARQLSLLLPRPAQLSLARLQPASHAPADSCFSLPALYPRPPAEWSLYTQRRMPPAVFSKFAYVKATSASQPDRVLGLAVWERPPTTVDPTATPAATESAEPLNEELEARIAATKDTEFLKGFKDRAKRTREAHAAGKPFWYLVRTPPPQAASLPTRTSSLVSAPADSLERSARLSTVASGRPPRGAGARHRPQAHPLGHGSGRRRRPRLLLRVVAHRASLPSAPAALRLPFGMTSDPLCPSCASRAAGREGLPAVRLRGHQVRRLDAV